MRCCAKLKKDRNNAFKIIVEKDEIIRKLKDKQLELKAMCDKAIDSSMKKEEIIRKLKERQKEMEMSMRLQNLQYGKGTTNRIYPHHNR